MDDITLRGFFKDHAEIIEEGEFEVYRIDEAHFARLRHLIDDIQTKQSGLGALPNMFLVGLVSAYDVFLSQLIRCIFLTKPQILSSSEKNISFR